MPYLDFPVGKWDQPWKSSWDHLSWEPKERTVLMQTFQPEDRRLNYCPDASSSLFLRDIHHQSIELWDVQEHPPRKTQLHFARPIIRTSKRPQWITSRYPLDCKERGWKELMPCLCLQAITLGQTRVVLAQTLAERTFHVIDEYGQPYLTHNVGVAQSTVSVRPIARECRCDWCDEYEYGYPRFLAPPASIVESRHQSYILNPSGCGHECKGLCQVPEWVDLKVTHTWKALRLPRRRESDADPGIFFYYVRDQKLPDDCMPDRRTVLEWALLLARSDRDSSDTMTSGEIDLASLTASHSSQAVLPRRLEDLDLRMLSPPSDDDDYIVQVFWRETEAAASPDGPVTRKYDVLVHMPLDALVSGEGQTHSQAAIARLESSWRWGLKNEETFRLSSDGLRLFALTPSPEPEGEEAFVALSIYARGMASQTWSTQPLIKRKLDPHQRIVGVFDHWLIIGRDEDGSVNLLSMSSPCGELQKFELRAEHFIDEHADRYGCRSNMLSLLAGGWVVLRWGDDLLTGMIDLTAPQGPALVDLDEVIRKCVAMHGPLPDSRPLASDYDWDDDRLRRAHERAKRRFKLLCHGDIALNPSQVSLYPDEPREPSRAMPLILFVCSSQALISNAQTWHDNLDWPITHPQFVLLLHPGSGAVESVRCCSPSDLFLPHGFTFQIATYDRRQVLLDATHEDSIFQMLIDFDAARACPLDPFEHQALVLGRWTNDNAKQLLVHSPRPVDPQRPKRRWFFLSNQDLDPPKVTTEDAEAQKEQDEKDDDDGGWAYNRYIKKSLPDEIFCALQVRNDFSNDPRVSEGLFKRVRLVPNWLLCGPSALYIGGLQRLLSFLTRPETSL